MNKLTNLYLVDGVPIYSPHGQVQESQEDLLDDNSGRTDDGVMHVQWVRSQVKKFQLGYNVLSSAEYEYMKNLLLGKTFVFTYWKNGQAQTMNAYCTSSGGALNYVSATAGRYLDVSFEISEL